MPEVVEPGPAIFGYTSKFSFVPGERSEPASSPLVNQDPQPGDAKVNPQDGQRWAWPPKARVERWLRACCNTELPWILSLASGTLAMSWPC